MNMNLKKIGTVFLLTAGLLGTRNAQAQTTYEEMEQLTVNEQVTTVITASEPVRMVDISTDKVVGDQPLDNIVRLKPQRSRARGRRGDCHRDRHHGTLPHAIRAGLHHTA